MQGWKARNLKLFDLRILLGNVTLLQTLWKMNRIVLNKFNNHYRQHSILLNFYYRIRER